MSPIDQPWDLFYGLPYLHGTYNRETHKVVPKDAIVLDLDDIFSHFGDTPRRENAEFIADALKRGGGIAQRKIADALLAQTQPPRPPEPGWGERVWARTSGTFKQRQFLNTGRGWAEREQAEGTALWHWDDLIDPVVKS